ncbi:MAG TPA: succinate dehydrogenase, cytochrome b556 subunit [Usitatibacter sp.]|nr:succinate dehydrogenase, cytochrome b556 subunit [Usitatibacter sp.]
MSATPKPRPKYYDLNLAHLPPPGLVSILHRISGLLLFFPILPVLLLTLQNVVGSEESFAVARGHLSHPFMKLLLVGFAWLYAHHFFAGLRYLLLDMHWGIDKVPARTSAYVVLVLGALTAIAAAVEIL